MAVNEAQLSSVVNNSSLLAVSSSADWAASFICPLKSCDSVFKRAAFSAFKIHFSQAPSLYTFALDKPSLNRLGGGGNLPGFLSRRIRQLPLSTLQYAVAKTLQKTKTGILRHKTHSRNTTVLETRNRITSKSIIAIFSYCFHSRG